MKVGRMGCSFQAEVTDCIKGKTAWCISGMTKVQYRWLKRLCLWDNTYQTMRDLTIISPFLDYVNVLAGSHWCDLDNKMKRSNLCIRKISASRMEDELLDTQILRSLIHVIISMYKLYTSSHLLWIISWLHIIPSTI